MATGKTNKSYTKRIKISKNGKLKVRAIGQNHFNAKSSGEKRNAKRRMTNIDIKKSDLMRFVPKS